MKIHRTNSVDAQSRAFAILGTAIFLLFAPGTIAGLVTRWIGGWRVHAPFFGFAALRVVGGVLMAGSLAFLLEAFARFALQGMGTPAPIYPTKSLVVSGTYRFVRNPMYVAAVSLILGQSLLFGDERILVYGLFVWLMMHLFVLIYEEPTLRRTFPADYAAFTANVPRWIPRLTPWHGAGQ